MIACAGSRHTDGVSVRPRRSPLNSPGLQLALGVGSWAVSAGLAVACNTYDPSLLGEPIQAEDPVAMDEPEPTPEPDNLLDLPSKPPEPAPAVGGAGSGGMAGAGGASPSGAPGGGGSGGSGGAVPSAGAAGSNGGGAGAGGAAGIAGMPVDAGAAGADAGVGGMGGSSSPGGAGAGATGGEPPMGGSGGSGGTGAEGGAGGATGPVACAGCARLSVPLDAAEDQAHYTLTLPGPTDLTQATLTFRVVREAGSGGEFRGYVQQGAGGDFEYALSEGTAISEIGRVPETIVWDLADDGSSFDLTAIERIGIEITASGSTSWTNPTVVLIDRIAVADANPAVSAWTFDAMSSVHTTPVEIYEAGPIWLNSYSADTTATGSEIGWIAQ